MADLSKEYIIEIITKNLGNAIAQLNKVDKAGQKVEKSTKGMNAEAARAHSIQEGLTAGATNATRAFDKQLKGLGGGATGLIQLYGGLAANAFAVTAAFRALSAAADYQNQIKAAEDYGVRTGQSLMQVAGAMRQVTGDAISMSDALRHASITSAAGFDSTDIQNLTTVAKKASLALGRNLTDSLERVFKGAVKAEPELLDELGIILRLKPATEAYAEELGKTASSLTTFEKQQAVLNEVLRQGEEKYGDLSDAVKTNPYDKLAASFSDMSKNLLGFINTIAGSSIVEAFASNMWALGAAVGLFATKIVTLAIPSLKTFGSTMISSVIAPLTDTATKLSVASEKMGTAFQDSAMERVNSVVATMGTNADGAAQDVDELTAAVAEMSGSVVKGMREAASGTVKMADVLEIAGHEADILQDKFDLSDEQTNKLKASQLKLAKTMQLVNAGSAKQIMGMTNLTLATRLYAVTTIAASKAAHAMAMSLKSMSAAAAVGGTLGLLDMIKVLKAKDINSAKEAVQKLGYAFKDAEGNSTGMSENLEAMHGRFGRMTKAAGLLGAAMSSMFKFLPIIGQAVMAYQLLAMVLSPVGKMLGIVNEENDAADKSMEEFGKTVTETSKKLDYFEETQYGLSDSLETSNKRLKIQGNMLQDISSGLKTVAAALSKADGIDTGIFDFTGVDLDDFKDSMTTMASQLVRLGATKDDVDDLMNAFSSSKTVTEASIAVEAFNEKVMQLRSAKAEAEEFNNRILELGSTINNLAKESKVLADLTLDDSMFRFAASLEEAVEQGEQLGAIDLTNFVDGLDKGLLLLAKAGSGAEIDNLTQKFAKIQADLKDNQKDIREGIEAQGTTQAYLNSLTDIELQNYINSKGVALELKDAVNARLQLEKESAALSAQIIPIQQRRLQQVRDFAIEQAEIVIQQQELTNQAEMIAALNSDSTAGFSEKLALMGAELGIKNQLLDIEKQQAELAAEGMFLKYSQAIYDMEQKIVDLKSDGVTEEEQRQIDSLIKRQEHTARLVEHQHRLVEAQKKSFDAKGLKNYNEYVGGLKEKLSGIVDAMLEGIDKSVQYAQAIAALGGEANKVLDAIYKPKADEAEGETKQLAQTLDLWKKRVDAIRTAGKTMKELGKVEKSALKIEIDYLNSLQKRTEEQDRYLQQLQVQHALKEAIAETERQAKADSSAIDELRAIEQSTKLMEIKAGLSEDLSAEAAAQIQLQLLLVKLGVEKLHNEEQLLAAYTKQNKVIQKIAKDKADKKALNKMQKDYEKTVENIGEMFGDMFNAAWDGGREGFSDYMKDLKDTLIKTFFDMAGKLVVGMAVNLTGLTGPAAAAGGAGGAAGVAGSATSAASGISSLTTAFSSLATITGNVTGAIGGLSSMLGATNFGAGAIQAGVALVTEGFGAYFGGISAAFSESLALGIGYMVPVIGWIAAAVAIIGSFAGWFDSEEAPSQIHMRSGANVKGPADAKKPERYAYGESLIGQISMNLQHIGKDEQMSEEDAKKYIDEVLQPMINMATAIDNAIVEFAELTDTEILALTDLTTREIDKKMAKMKNMNPDVFLKERLEIILDNVGGEITELHGIFQNLEDVTEYSFAQFATYAGALLTYASSVGEQKNVFTTLINESFAMAGSFEELRKEGEPLLATIVRVGAQLQVVNTVFGSFGWELKDISAAGAEAADSFITLMGGIENFMEAVDFYSQNFLSVEEQMTNSADALVNQWGNLSLSGDVDMEDFPQTRADFIALMNSADDELKALLLNMAPQFDQFYDAMENSGDTFKEEIEIINEMISVQEELKKTYEGLASAVSSLIDSIKKDIKDIRKTQGVGSNLGLLESQVYSDLDFEDPEAIQERIDLANEYRTAVLDTMEQQIEALEDQIDIIENLREAGQSLLDLVDSLTLDRGLTPLTTPEQYLAALAEYNSLLQAAQGGDVDAASKLESLAPKLLELGKLMFGGTAGADYNALFTMITSTLSDLGTSLVELTTEDLLDQIRLVQENAVDKLTELNNYLETVLLPGIEDQLENIILELQLLNTTLERVQGDTGDTALDVGSILRSALARWSAPIEVELVGGTSPAGTAPDPLDPNNGNGNPSLDTENLDNINTLLEGTFGDNGTMWSGIDWGDGVFPRQHAMGGIADIPSIFGEAGPEAAVPLPDGRTIPVTISSPVVQPVSDDRVSSIVENMQEVQIQNAIANQELADSVEELREEIANLKNSVGAPIVDAVKERRTASVKGIV